MLAALGLAIVGITGFLWFRLIQNVAVPRNRAPYLAAFLTGGVLGVMAMIEGAGWASNIMGGLAAVVGFGFPALRLQSAQQPNEPAVQLGGPMLDFTAPDETGADFSLSSLTGKPYLLKFFRGHW